MMRDRSRSSPGQWKIVVQRKRHDLAVLQVVNLTAKLDHLEAGFQHVLHKSIDVCRVPTPEVPDVIVRSMTNLAQAVLIIERHTDNSWTRRGLSWAVLVRERRAIAVVNFPIHAH